MNDAQINTLMAPSLTAGELVNIAHVLIDKETAAWTEPGSRPDFHAGALRGITAMCAAATSALNACGNQAAAPATGVPANAITSASAAAATLHRLDGYMAASGYGADHPWRREIAGASQRYGLAAASAVTVPAAPASTAPDSGLTAEKMAKLVTMQRRACDILEASDVSTQCEAAGDLRSAVGDLWDAVREQLNINMMPSTLDNWMTTPASLARVLVAALRKERIDESGQYNDAVEDCIVAVIGTLAAGAGADPGVESASLPASASGPDLSDRLDLQMLRARLVVDLAEPAPKIRIEDVVETLAQLRDVADEAIDDDATAVCRRATRIIEGLLPHAGAGVAL